MLRPANSPIFPIPPSPSFKAAIYDNGHSAVNAFKTKQQVDQVDFNCFNLLYILTQTLVVITVITHHKKQKGKFHSDIFSSLCNESVKRHFWFFSPTAVTFTRFASTLRNPYQACLMRFFSPTAVTFTRFASTLRNPFQACLMRFFFPTAATFYKICLYS